MFIWKSIRVIFVIALGMYASMLSAQEIIWQKDFWDSTEVSVDKSGDNWAFLLTSGDTVGLQLDSTRESIFLTKVRLPLDLNTGNITIEYRIKFYFIDTVGSDLSQATINLVFDPPPVDSGWWADPIGDGRPGYLNPPVSKNYIHSFGPNINYGGRIGISDNVEGGGLSDRSAPYPKNGEWLKVTVHLFPDTIITISQGDSGYARVETTQCDLSQYSYFTPAFGDQHKTRVIVDKISVYRTSTLRHGAFTSNQYDAISLHPDAPDRVIAYDLSAYTNKVDSLKLLYGYVNFAQIVNEYPAGIIPTSGNFKVKVGNSLVDSISGATNATTMKREFDITPYYNNTDFLYITFNYGGGDPILIIQPVLVIYKSKYQGKEEKVTVKGYENTVKVGPNPFTQTTEIKYRLTANSLQLTAIKVYDLSGRLVKTLLNKHQKSGYYTITWDGTNNAGKRVSSGIYFICLDAGKWTATRKICLIK